MTNYSLQNDTESYINNIKRKHRMKIVITALFCAVFVFTTYTLILPAITMETQGPICGIEENHVHSEECYDTITVPGSLDCTVPLHEHNSSCFDGDGNVICGYSDRTIHTHSSECFDEHGKLICNIRKTAIAHTHDEDCYETVADQNAGTEETGADTGSDLSESSVQQDPDAASDIADENTDESAEIRRQLICTQPEVIEHKHTIDCFEFSEGFDDEGFDPSDYDTVDWDHCRLICGKTQVLVHQHNESCIVPPTEEQVLICSIPEGHHHDPVDCYPEKTANVNDAENEIGSEADADAEAGSNANTGAEAEAGSDANTGAEAEAAADADANTGTDAEAAADADANTGTDAEAAADPDANTGTDAEAGSDNEDQTPVIELKNITMALMTASPLLGAADDTYDLTDYITNVTGTGTIQNADGSFTTTLNLQFEMHKSIISSEVASGLPFVYNLPDGIRLTPSLVEGGPYTAYKRGTTDTVAFTYRFVENSDSSYNIEIIYDPDYVNNIPSDQTEVVNDLSFRANIDDDLYNDETGITVNFTDDLKLVIPPENIVNNSDIAVSKIGYYQRGDKLFYRVYVSSSKGTPGPITLNDRLTCTGDGDISEVTLIDVKNSSGISVKDDTDVVFTPDPNTHEAFQLSLPQLNAGETYTITYEYSITGLSGNAEVSATNMITAESTDGHDTVNDIAASTIYSTPRTVISKSGEEAPDGVRWTITINEAGTDIAGKLLSDPMFAQLSSNDISIYNSTMQRAAFPSEYTILYNDNNEISAVQFNAGSGNTNTNTYTVAYTVPAGSSDLEFGEERTVTNNAGFDGESVTGETGVTGGSVSKNVTGYSAPDGSGSGTITWSVSVNIPEGGIRSGSQVTDDLNGQGHYMTPAQAIALRAALQNQWGNDLCGLTFTDANDQTVDPGSAPADTHITGYSFTIGPKNETGLLYAGGDVKTWSYVTTADLGDRNTGTFRNDINVKDIQASAEKTFSPNVKKYNLKPGENGGNPSFSEETVRMDITDPDAEFVWMVEVKTAGDTSQYTVVDTLPEGVEPVDIYLWPSSPAPSAYNYTNDNYRLSVTDGVISGPPIGFFNYTISGSVENSKVTLTLEPPGTGIMQSFYIVYVCRLSDAVWPASGSSQRFILGNTVSVLDGGDEYGEAGSTQIIDASSLYQALSKSGVWNKDSQTVTYTLDINPDAEDLIPGADTLTLKDELTYPKTISMSPFTTSEGPTTASLISVLLEKNVNGSWITEPVSWSASAAAGTPYYDNTYTHLITPETSTLTMDIPDGTHLRLTYVYEISSDFTESDVDLHNSADLEGTATSTEEEDNHISHEDFETHGSSTFEGKAFYLEKVTEDDHSLPVEGAVFRVYKYEPWYPGPGWFQTDKTYTTDPDGKIVIQQTDKLNEEDASAFYAFDAAYYVIEESAPSGYETPDDPPKLYFWFGSEGAVDLSNRPADFPSDAPNISATIANTVVTNKMIPSYILPDAGGSGTTLFTIGGLALAAGSLLCGLALELRRKRPRMRNRPE